MGAKGKSEMEREKARVGGGEEQGGGTREFKSRKEKGRMGEMAGGGDIN